MIKNKIDRVIFICNSSSHPRIQKRVKVLSSIITSKVFGFRRHYYELNEFNSSVDYTSLGYIENGKYFKRSLKIVLAWMKILKASKKSDSVYSFGLDCFIIGKMCGFKHSIVELGDLRCANKPNAFISKLERFFLKKADVIVITSPYFYDCYFKKYGFDEKQFLVIENKLPDDIYFSYEPASAISSGDKIRIGLIGFFRYKKQIENIIEFVKGNEEKFTLECYGSGPYLDLILSENSDSINYHGEFVYSKGLCGIYSNVDISYVCYEPTDENVKIALPNKLYESIYYNTPIICSQGTALQYEVEKLGIGLSVHSSNIRTLTQALMEIDNELINEWSENCKKVERETLLDDGLSRLSKLFN